MILVNNKVGMTNSPYPHVGHLGWSHPTPYGPGGSDRGRGGATFFRVVDQAFR